MVQEQPRYPCSTQRVDELYERLRDYVLHSVDTSAQFHGLGIMMLRGMAAWIGAASQYAQREDRFDNTCRETVALHTDDKTRFLAVLTDMMVFHCHREVS